MIFCYFVLFEASKPPEKKFDYSAKRTFEYDFEQDCLEDACLHIKADLLVGSDIWFLSKNGYVMIKFDSNISEYSVIKFNKDNETELTVNDNLFNIMLFVESFLDGEI